MYTFDENKSSFGFPDPETDPENNEKKNNDCQIVLQKGLKSFENPVLRGSFSLVLTNEQMEFYEEIAKKAFCEIMEYKLVGVQTKSPELFTKHLKTDPGKVQKGRAGVYIIMNIQDKKCIIGQTKNLRKRFNQYTSRGKGVSEQTLINKNFFLAVQKELLKGLDYCQVFQCFVVYTWVDENKQPLDVQNSLQFLNEMRFLEHRLILAFFESGLCYNIEDVAPLLSETPTISVSEFQAIQKVQKIEDMNCLSAKEGIEAQSFCVLGKGPKHPKPFQVHDFYFLSTTHYALFRNSLPPQERKNFLSMPWLRKLLRANEGNLTSNIRYLTSDEIQQGFEQNIFFQPSSEMPFE